MTRSQSNNPSFWKISTHTLTWSVTTVKINRMKITIKFQLTRSRGAWLAPQTNTPTGRRFQLTRSRGAWQHEAYQSTEHETFQLTRSRGAWHFCTSIYIIIIIFQLTRSRGAWLNGTLPNVNLVSFQLTRSRGAWLEAVTVFIISGNFNSHAHVERDKSFKKWNHISRISTHTLTWSVTVRVFK